MKYAIPAAFAVMGALALSAPASAQIVNGQGGMTPTAEAPIGTKAGGSSASMQAPGEGPAVQGAIDNNAQAKNMGTITKPVRHRRRPATDTTATTGN
jgi:hypothetical protein